MKTVKKQPPKFTRTECAIILALHWGMPVKGSHRGRGAGHDESCFRSCYDTWRRDVHSIALLLSFVRPTLDKYAFFESCVTLPKSVTKKTDGFWKS